MEITVTFLHMIVLLVFVLLSWHMAKEESRKRIWKLETEARDLAEHVEELKHELATLR